MDNQEKIMQGGQKFAEKYQNKTDKTDSEESEKHQYQQMTYI